MCLKTGDTMSVVDQFGNFEKAFILLQTSCDKALTVYIPRTGEVRMIKKTTFANVVQQYLPDLENLSVCF